MLSQTAKDLYFVINTIPSWLPMIEKFTGDSEDDLHEFADYMQRIETDYKKEHSYQVRQSLFDFKQELLAEYPELQPRYKSNEDVVTNEMIQRARDFPITELIDNKRLWALCPFHPDRKPSLFLKNNFYHCFVCEAHGDTISLVQHIYNVDFKTAVKVLQ